MLKLRGCSSRVVVISLTTDAVTVGMSGLVHDLTAAKSSTTTRNDV